MHGVCCKDEDVDKVLAPDGAETRSSQAAPKSTYNAQIEAFAQALLTGAKTGPCAASTHLATVAVIETAYLSARTGEPESPQHLYHLHDLPTPSLAEVEQDKAEEPPEQT